MSEEDFVIAIATICGIWIAYCCLDIVTGDRRND